MRPKEVLFLRHGATAFTEPPERFCGHCNPSLTEAGRAQVQLLADHFGRNGAPELILTSPLDRAVQTAEVLSHTLSLRVEIEHDLKETDFGIWEGLTKDQACAAAREVFHAWESNPSAVGPPGGEPLHMALQRAQRLRGVVLGHGELTLLLVSHKSFLRIAICHWLGLDPALYRTLLDLEPAGLGCVSLTGQSGTLRLLNWTPTLESVTHRDP